MESESEARGASARAAMLREYLTDPEHLLSVDQDGTRWAEVNVAEVLALLDALDAAEEWPEWLRVLRDWDGTKPLDFGGAYLPQHMADLIERAFFAGGDS